MPSAKKRAAKAAQAEEDERGEGFMALDGDEEDNTQPAARGGAASPSPRVKQAADQEQGSRVMYIG